MTSYNKNLSPNDPLKRKKTILKQAQVINSSNSNYESQQRNEQNSDQISFASRIESSEDSRSVSQIAKFQRQTLKKQNFLVEEAKRQIQIRKSKKIDYEDQKLVGYSIYEAHGKILKYSMSSLFILGKENSLRKGALWLTEAKQVLRQLFIRQFEFFILCCITMNSVSMAFTDFSGSQKAEENNKAIQIIGQVCTYIFMLESLLKIVSQGFVISKYSYLRDWWNVLDFIIVLTGIFEILPGINSGNFKVLRTLRVLRPLKTIKSIRSMRILVSTVISSIPDLVQVTVFLAFMFLIFGILGLQLFMGVVYQRCRVSEAPTNATYWAKDHSQQRPCSLNSGGLNQCQKGTFCGSPSEFNMSFEMEGIEGDSQIQFGIAMFDNIFQSMLAVFQTITFDSWTLILYNLRDSSVSFLATIFSNTIVVMGSFFMLQMVLAVILRAFEKISEKEAEYELQQRKIKLLLEQEKEEQEEILTSLQRGRILLNNQQDDQSSQISIQELSLQPIQRVAEQNKKNLLTTSQSFKDKQKKKQKLGQSQFKKIKTLKRENSQNESYFSSNEQTLQKTPLGSLNNPEQSQFQSDSKSKLSQGIHKKDQLQIKKPSFLGSINQENSSQNSEANLKVIENQNQKEEFQNSQISYELESQQIYQKEKGSSDSGKIEKQFLQQPQQKEKITIKSFARSQPQLVGQKKRKFLLPPRSIKDDYSDKVTENLLARQETRLRMNKERNQNDTSSRKEQRQSFETTIKIRNSILKIKQLQLLENKLFHNSFQKQKTGKVEREKQLRKIITRRIKQADQESAASPISKRSKVSNSELAFKVHSAVLRDEQLKSMKISRQEANQKEKELKEEERKLEKQISQIKQEFKEDLQEERKNQGVWFYQVSKFLDSKLFSSLVSIIILINLLIMCQDSYPKVERVSQIIEISNYCFLTFYFFEVFIKLIAMGWRLFCLDNFNLFDLAIVLISIIDVFYLLVAQESSFNSIILGFKGLRLLRVFRIAKSWKSLKILLVTISNSFQNLSSILALALLFIFIYSLLGMELFSYQAKFNQENVLDLENGEYPPDNFNTIKEAAVSVFIILANDGWSTIFFNHYRSSGGIKATIYFISFIVIGQYMLLNLLLTILLKDFDGESELISRSSIKSEEKKKNNEKSKNKQSIFQQLKLKLRQSLTWNKNQIAVAQECEDSQASVQLSEISQEKEQEQEELLVAKNIETGLKRYKEITLDIETEKLVLKGKKTLNLFPFDSTFRLKVKRLVISKEFEFSILAIVILQTVLLAFENPLNNPDTTIYKVTQFFDYILTTIFLIEMLLKISAFGFIFCGKRSFMRSGWNVIDFLIVSISFFSFFPFLELGILKVFRLFKILRPVKMIGRNSYLKIAIESLISASPQIINVFLIWALTVLIFSLAGMGFFAGNFYYCNHIEFDNIELINKWDCLNSGASWQNYEVNFDNIGSAMDATDGISSTVGWAATMYRATAFRGIDLIPEQAFTFRSSIFFIVFIFIACFFFTNLFVGVVISSYNAQKEALGNDFLLTSEQKQWVETKVMIINSKPKLVFKRPKSTIRSSIFDICQNKYFEVFVFLLIIVNTVSLMFKYRDQSQYQENLIEQINEFVSIIFIIEAILKLISYGKAYFKSNWNVFDFSVVLITIFSYLIERLTSIGSSIGPIAIVIRALKIGRVMKLARVSKSLVSIYETFLIALPGLLNLGSLLMLFLYIYAIMGVYLFAEVKQSGVLDDHANFQSLGNSMQTLMRMSTGENWHLTKFALQRRYSLDFQCIESPSYKDYIKNNNQTIGCGVNEIASAFFITFLTVFSLIFLNLFIAIILQKHQETQDNNETILQPEIKEKFQDCWAKFDQDSTGYIKVCELIELLHDLGEPLGWGYSYREDQEKQDKFLGQMDLKTYSLFDKKIEENSHFVLYMEVLEKLTFFMMVNKEVEEAYQRGSEIDTVQKKQKAQEKLNEHFAQIGSKKNKSSMLVQEFEEKRERFLIKKGISSENALKLSLMDTINNQISANMKKGQQIEFAGTFQRQLSKAQNQKNPKIQLEILEEAQENQTSSFGSDETPISRAVNSTIGKPHGLSESNFHSKISSKFSRKVAQIKKKEKSIKSNDEDVEEEEVKSEETVENLKIDGDKEIPYFKAANNNLFYQNNQVSLQKSSEDIESNASKSSKRSKESDVVRNFDFSNQNFKKQTFGAMDDY